MSAEFPTLDDVIAAIPEAPTPTREEWIALLDLMAERPGEFVDWADVQARARSQNP